MRVTAGLGTQRCVHSEDSAEVGGAVRTHNGINHPDEYSQVFGEWGLGSSGGSKEGGGK